jgi:hypothetical protein
MFRSFQKVHKKYVRRFQKVVKKILEILGASNP